jgi:hypothetical protein
MGTIWLGAAYFLAAAHVHPIRSNGREWARSGRGLDDRAVAQHRRATARAMADIGTAIRAASNPVIIANPVPEEHPLGCSVLIRSRSANSRLRSSKRETPRGVGRGVQAVLCEGL